MKYREILLDQLKPLPYFDKQAVYQLSDQYGLKSTTVDTYISRSLKRKEIVSLKKGLYVSANFYNEHKDDISYLFYLANIIRTPSYVSSWAALQYYDLVTEAVYTITSVTPKVTRAYKTKVGNFTYQSLQKELFSDFSSIKGNFNFFIASPSKALFDLLYLKTRQFRGLHLADIKTLVNELRIDLNEMSHEEQKNFFSLVKNCLHYG